MKQRLRVPAVLAFAIGGSVAIAASLGTTSCDSGDPPQDAQIGCMLFCIPDGTDAGVCPSPSQCADAGPSCPAGCQPVG